MNKLTYRLAHFFTTIVFSICFLSFATGQDLKYNLPVFHKGDFVSVIMYSVDSAPSESFKTAVDSAAGITTTGAGQNGYMADSNGEIDLPLVGKMKIENLTLAQAHDAIFEKVKPLLKDATVILKSKALNNLPVFHKGDFVFVIMFSAGSVPSESFKTAVDSAAGTTTTGAGQNGYMVDSNGEIDLPLVGKMKIENLTLAQAHDAIFEKVKPLLKEATVILKSKALNGRSQ